MSLLPFMDASISSFAFTSMSELPWALSCIFSDNSLPAIILALPDSFKSRKLSFPESIMLGLPSAAILKVGRSCNFTSTLLLPLFSSVVKKGAFILTKILLVDSQRGYFPPP